MNSQMPPANPAPSLSLQGVLRCAHPHFLTLRILFALGVLVGCVPSSAASTITDPGVIILLQDAARIDSGGGIATVGAGTNHSSIGAAYATSDSATGVIEILYPPAPVLDSGADSDSNGLPDAWEIEHFGAIGVDPAADADGDGTTNLMEYLAGTDPISAASVFRPTSHTSGGDLVLTVPTVSGRHYRVWGTANLQGTWTPHDTITGDGSTVEWLYPLNQSSRYFLRIEILIPQPN